MKKIFTHHKGEIQNTLDIIISELQAGNYIFSEDDMTNIFWEHEEPNDIILTHKNTTYRYSSNKLVDAAKKFKLLVTIGK